MEWDAFLQRLREVVFPVGLATVAFLLIAVVIWLLRSPAAAIENLSLVAPAQTGPGVTRVPLASIPIERIWAASDQGSDSFQGAAVATPLGAIDLIGSPLGAIPLGAIPLGAIGTESTPLGAILLSSIPINDADEGWEQLLEGTDLADNPLQTITLADAIAAGVDLPDTLTIDQIGLEGSPLGAISLVSAALGNTPLGAIGSDPNDICDDPAVPEGVPCDENTTVLQLELLGTSISALPLGAIPLGAIDLEDAPLRDLPLGAIPLGAIPLGTIPLGAIDLETVPLGAIPMAATPLGAIPLGAIPLGAIDLEGTPLGAIPLGAIGEDGACNLTDCLGLSDDDSLHDLAVALEADGSSLEATPLGAIPLGAIPLGAIPLGAIPLGAIDLEGTPLGAIPLGAIGKDGACNRTDCLGLSNDDSLHDLAVAVEANGSSLADTDLADVPLGAIPLGAIPLGAIPLGAIPLGAIDLDGTPLGAIPLGAIEVDGGVCNLTDCLGLGNDDSLHDLAVAVEANGSSLADTDLVEQPLGAIPLGAIPLGAIPLGAIDLVESPLGAIGTEDLPDRTVVVTCTLEECPTLADAQELDAVLPDATVEDLGLGLLFGYHDIGEQDEFFGITLGQLLVAMMVRSDYPWEELPFEALGVQDFAPDPTVITYTATFDVDGGVGDEPVEIVVTLPQGFRYRSGSSRFAGSSAADPAISGESIKLLTWRVDAAADTPAQRLSFGVIPSLRLGTGRADVSVTALESGDVGDTAAARVEVVDDVHEQGPVELPNDTWMLSYIDEPGERDLFAVPTPGDGHRVTVFVGNPAVDVDLVAYRPFEEAVPSARAIPLGAIAVPADDPAFRPDAKPPPETAGDVPIEDLPVGAVSARAGAAVEEVSVSQRGTTEDDSTYTVQITGYNNATADDPYRIRRKTRAEEPVPVCSRRHVDPAPATGSIAYDELPADLESLFLISPHRLDEIHQGGAATIVLDGMEGKPGLNELIRYLTETDGFGAAWMISVDDDAAVRGAFDAADANPCDPHASNEVAAAIRGIVLQVMKLRPTLRYVTIVGNDEVIPMWRIPDHAELANEAHFASTFNTEEGKALYGAMVTRHYLSDSPYFDEDPIPLLDRHLHVPELAGGRLIEDVNQILTQITTFLDFDGTLDPKTARTAGYDFLADATEVITELLNDHGYDAKALPEGWNADDLDAAINAGHDILSPNAHYDYYRALPADQFAIKKEERLFEVPRIVSPKPGSIVFTMGCHAGLNVVAIGNGVPDKDFADTYAGFGVNYLANTGYGFGDTDIVDLSEELMVNFARFLDGSLTLGQADVAARQRFFADQAMFTPYHEKSLQQAVLYGLPMYRIGGSPAGLGLDEGPAITLDPVTALESARIPMKPTFNEETEGTKGTYYSVGEDRETQGVHDRPIQPFTSVEVTRAGHIARGAVFESLITDEVSLGDPAFFRPVIDHSENEPELEVRDVLFPTTFLTVSTFNWPSADGPAPVVQRQQVNIIPGQYLGDGDTQRRFREFLLRVYYAPAGSTDFTAPTIATTNASLVGDQVTFVVKTDDDVVRVLTLYRDTKQQERSVWTAVDLAAGPDGSWTGGGPTEGADTIDYLVQVVDSSGNTAVSTNKGEYHDADPPEDRTPDGPIRVTLIPDVKAGEWATVPVMVTVEPATGVLATVDGVETALERGSFTISDDGAHTVHLVSDSGDEETFGVAIDTTDPRVAIGTPGDGTTYELGSLVVTDFACLDAGSGVVSCESDIADGSLLDTSVPGSFTLTVTATDRVGHVAVETHAYRVAGSALLARQVKRGDSLWRVAEVILIAAGNPDPTNAEINRFWRLIYERSRDVIGDNPDLILPGQELTIPRRGERAD